MRETSWRCAVLRNICSLSSVKAFHGLLVLICIFHTNLVSRNYVYILLISFYQLGFSAWIMISWHVFPWELHVVVRVDVGHGILFFA